MLYLLNPRWLFWLFLFAIKMCAMLVETQVQTEQECQKSAEMVIQVDEPEKPAMVAARLEGGYGDHIIIKNTYDVDSLSRDVVGMVGVPIEVSGFKDGTAKEPISLVFVYDPQKLECEETDLRVLWYNESTCWYETLFDYNLDTERHELTVPVEQPGTYVLEDIKIWTSVWDGTYVDEETRKEPVCHWHNHFSYEDIEALADTSLYDESREYHITTIEQLAGLVKLVNEGESFYGCEFYLDEDLDLEGYDWVPIGWYYPADKGNLWKDFPFEGVFYGNGHTIYNMRIVAPDQSDLGMFGRTLQAFRVHDLSLVDCYIEGKFYIGGILGDNINSGESFDMTNCHVTGTVKGQLKSGALVGSSAYLRMKDCTAVMEAGCVTELAGDLRGGYMENCEITIEKKQKFTVESRKKN